MVLPPLQPTLGAYVRALAARFSSSPTASPVPLSTSVTAVSVSTALPSLVSLSTPSVLAAVPALSLVTEPAVSRGGAPATLPVVLDPITPTALRVGFWDEERLLFEFLLAMHSSLTEHISTTLQVTRSQVHIPANTYSLSSTSLRRWIKTGGKYQWDTFHLFSLEEQLFLQSIGISSNRYLVVLK